MIGSFKSKSYNVMKLTDTSEESISVVKLKWLKCARHRIHVIVDRQIAYVCEPDQMAEFHIRSGAIIKDEDRN